MHDKNPSTKTKDLTVYIGRFSPIHHGHEHVLRRAIQTSKIVLVLVGSANRSRSVKNPFTYAERKDFIEHIVMEVLKTDTGPCQAVLVRPLSDHMYNDTIWIQNVQNAVSEVTDAYVDTLGLNPSVYITGANRDHSTWYLNAFGGMFKDDTIDHTKNTRTKDLSATTIRDKWFVGDPSYQDFVYDYVADAMRRMRNTQEGKVLLDEWTYLKNYKKHYEGLKYPVSIQTVDACVIQSGHVLLATRTNFPGKGLWCLPGGHLDVDKPEKLLDAAIRELKEETSIEMAPAQLYGSVKSKEVFDHPDRSLKARVISMCYLFKLNDTKGLPRVKNQHGETENVRWVPIAQALASPERFFEDHWEMLQIMSNRV